MKIKFINTVTMEPIISSSITNDIILLNGELWEVCFGTQEGEDELTNGWAFKIKQPYKIVLDESCN